MGLISKSGGSRDRCLNLSDEVQYFPNRSVISLETKNAIFLLRMNNYHKSAISILPMEPFDDTVTLSSVSRNRPKDPIVVNNCMPMNRFNDHMYWGFNHSFIDLSIR